MVQICNKYKVCLVGVIEETSYIKMHGMEYFEIT